MLIKVDYRDAELYSKCNALLSSDLEKYASIKIEKLNIPLGDVIVMDDNGKEKIIIERKSLNDLASSIRDGRYAEQSFRLNECSMHNHMIYYVIEGDLRSYKPFKVDKKTLLSSMVSMSFFKGFSVHRTLNLDETAEWIVQFAYKLFKEGIDAKPFYEVTIPIPISNTIQTDTPIPTHEETSNTLTYLDVCNTTRIKKNNITPENIGAIMLSQIPNVSTTTANTIMEHFGDMVSLIKALTESVNALDNISVINKTGKSRKLNKPSIANIYTYLLPNKNNLLEKGLTKTT